MKKLFFFITFFSFFSITYADDIKIIELHNKSIDQFIEEDDENSNLDNDSQTDKQLKTDSISLAKENPSLNGSITSNIHKSKLEFLNFSKPSIPFFARTTL